MKDYPTNGRGAIEFLERVAYWIACYHGGNEAHHLVMRRIREIKNYIS